MVSREMALDIIDPRRKFPYLAIMNLEELQKIADSRFWIRPDDSSPKKSLSHSSPSIKSSFIPFETEKFGIDYADCLDDVRKPDPVYRETLIGGSGFREYDTGHIDQDDIQSQHDIEYQKAINESLKSFEAEKHKTHTIEDLEMEDIINSLANDLPEEVSNMINDLADFNPLLEKWKHLDIPPDFDFSNLSVIDLIYDDLLKEDFCSAKKRISEISNLKHMDWIKSLSYNDIPLKTMILNKNKEAHRCLK
jgi:hypothetical protein